MSQNNQSPSASLAVCSGLSRHPNTSLPLNEISMIQFDNKESVITGCDSRLYRCSMSFNALQKYLQDSGFSALFARRAGDTKGPSYLVNREKAIAIKPKDENDTDPATLIVEGTRDLFQAPCTYKTFIEAQP